MSDRIDTEAVREAWPIPVGSPYTQGALAARTMHALCDEVDRLRAALRVIASGIVWGGDSQKIARAALAEGDTERPATMDTGLVEVRQVRCPTCGGNTPIRRLIPFESDDPEAPEWEDCPDPWHRPAPLVEGEHG